MRGLFYLVFVGVVGCGSSSSDGPAQPATDAGADTGTVATKSMKVVTWRAKELPVGDIKVFALAKDGTVLASTTTGADGVGTLEGFELSAETAFLALGQTGHGVEVSPINKADAEKNLSLLGRKPGDPFPLYCFPHVSRYPKLTGKAIGVTDGNNVIVSSTVGGSVYSGDPAKLSLGVQPGAKGTLVGVENSVSPAGRAFAQTIGKWASLEHAALTANTPFDFDFAKGTALTPKRVKLKYEIAGGADGPLGGDTQAFAFMMRGEEGGAVVGLPVKTEPTTDGASFDVELEYVEPSFPGTTRTLLRIGRPDGANSERLLERLPTEGEVIKDFHLPLAITTTKQALTDPIAIEGVPKDSAAIVIAQKANGDLLFRSFLTPAFAASGSVQLPKLPDELRALLPATLPTRIMTVHFVDAKNGIADARTQSRALTLTP